ncbi:YfiT family bacillithiol transferase [Marinirhabdus gelatinilytica]|uniref:DinB family protein n=1 Tax=Marinirhabdus gelatinilytica TaxID=1703343 RepID=A0A370QEX0_9FLAO|nr:putative metal-dependent hydrolase [Marinirhabdus gelatinilytica]RDK86917.1 DinB family protein [Marinirhabdus gelatinilytica]
MNIEALQYPIGTFKKPENISEKDIQEAITILEIFPEQLRLLTAHLPEDTLKQPYRPEGWTIRQLIHHIADSHHHSYTRLKWTLTEDTPAIKGYNEKDWAALGDSTTMPIAWSLTHVEALHYKMTYLLKSLTTEQWERTYQHPDKEEPTTLKEHTLIYAWHSMHHFAHIKNALDRMD